MAPGVLQKLGSVFNKKDSEPKNDDKKEDKKEIKKEIKETTLTETQITEDGENVTVLTETITEES